MTVSPQQIKVRKVTHWQPTFTHRESGQTGSTPSSSSWTTAPTSTS